MAVRFSGCSKNSAVLICQTFRLLKSRCTPTTQTHRGECISFSIDLPKMISARPSLVSPSYLAHDNCSSQTFPAIVKGPHVRRYGCSVAVSNGGQGNFATPFLSAHSRKQFQLPCQTRGFASYVRQSPNTATTQVRSMHAMQLDSAGGDDELDDGVKLPTVKWDKNNVNRITLSGYITEPERTELNSGAVVTKFRVAVRKQVSVLEVEEEDPSAEVDKDWFTVECWEAMADAVQELTRGSHVAVQGRLRQNEYTDREGNRRQAVVVRANNVGVVIPDGSEQEVDNRQYSSPPGNTREIPTPRPAVSSGARNGRVLVKTEVLWEELFKFPHLYYDNRREKSKPQAPDFKRKQCKSDPNAQFGEGLWLSSKDTPDWVTEELRKMDQRNLNSSRGVQVSTPQQGGRGGWGGDSGHPNF